MNIKELAVQAGFGFDGYYDYVTQEALERFAELVAAAERESVLMALDSDLEHGVKCLSENAYKNFTMHYPALNKLFNEWSEE